MPARKSWSDNERRLMVEHALDVIEDAVSGNLDDLDAAVAEDRVAAAGEILGAALREHWPGVFAGALDLH